MVKFYIDNMVFEKSGRALAVRAYFNQFGDLEFREAVPVHTCASVMASFERLSVQRARRPSADGGEGSVWRRFRHPLTFRHKAAPTHVEFSPVAPHDFAVASSLQVDVFSTRTTAIYRSLTRFKDVVHCCSYRGDGKMLAAGDDAGTVQIFDLGSRAVMRTFRGHQRAVHVARFTPDGSNVFTASDDQRAICWDVAAETQVRRFDGHTDFVRCGALNPNSPKLLVTGSYDHTVRLWDVNSPKCIMELQHAAPVEVRAVASGSAHCTPHTPGLV
jgi:U3 small nucleolar RNA-associated protein 15